MQSAWSQEDSARKALTFRHVACAVTRQCAAHSIARPWLAIQCPDIHSSPLCRRSPAAIRTGKLCKERQRTNGEVVETAMARRIFVTARLRRRYVDIARSCGFFRAMRYDAK